MNWVDALEQPLPEWGKALIIAVIFFTYGLGMGAVIGFTRRPK